MKKYIFLKVVLGFLIVLMAFFSGTIVFFKINYPISYNTEIINYSKKYDLDEVLVRAIIKVESGNNSFARSRVGAIGLMQIMPKTAEFISEELGFLNFKMEMLYDPAINIEMGCYYLRYLFNKYENEHKVLFCYNAGEGVMNSLYSSSEPMILENIEIEETKNYIKKVQKSKQVYDKIKGFLN